MSRYGRLMAQGEITYALLPGAGGRATWFYSRLTPLLQRAGHEAIAIDLPGADGSAGLPEYAEIVTRALEGRSQVVLVAQSMGGFTAPLVAQRTPLESLVLLNAMIPVPGERAGEWWENTGVSAEREAAARRHGYPENFDLETYFLHDMDPVAVAQSEEEASDEAAAAFDSPCAFGSWPDVPLHVVAGADDRFFPVEFQQRLARERLGLEADVLPGGHMLALSQPTALAAYLLEL
ncbi:alpha/beta hydrolase [Nocardioides sp. CER19]|uniref:alpha/beta fold hydrolase n=1 Tax=Nocardioides sp. CER19 TaxID=3038538 RepID=UPI002449922F|nr:alpha/beta hydrolase [Nocardioides sp. CER19]MDH2413799.1 alpha/beta hydrolase [Nocardioides sp. CER19]